MNTLIIAGIYYREKVIEGLFPACVIGFAIMLLPLLLKRFSTKMALKAIKVLVYTLFPICFFSYAAGAMYPPYGHHVFIFFLSISAFISLSFFAKEIGLIKVIPMYVLITLLFLMTIQVPHDLKAAYDGTMKTKEELFNPNKRDKS
ncbi:MAG: hypothetical protein HRT88_21410 [Lentisphaeraceae bacterium]|nr:hypothetical protein [Lentisphaeraceae bacterium]